MRASLGERVAKKTSATPGNNLASQHSKRVADRPGDHATTPRAAWSFGRISVLPPQAGIQRKLAVGRVDDPLEREADRVADRVMRMPVPGPLSTTAPMQVSRKCAACEEETGQTVQRSPLASPRTAIDDASGIVHEVLRTPGQPLDHASRAFFEPRFGDDFSRVRVHADRQAARSARAIGALAYTAANHIVFGVDHLPHQVSSYRLMAHELAHVVQQGGAAPKAGAFAGHTTATAARDGAAGGAQIQRQVGGGLSDLNMPAFPCNRGGGIELCNTTKDSPSAPNYEQCMGAARGIIDSCERGKDEECLAEAKCHVCQCVGERYCQCTGIV